MHIYLSEFNTGFSFDGNHQFFKQLIDAGIVKLGGNGAYYG
jgi:hypothetical protein